MTTIWRREVTHTIQGRWNQSFIRFIESDNTANTQSLQLGNIFGEWNRTEQNKLKNNTTYPLNTKTGTTQVQHRLALEH